MVGSFVVFNRAFPHHYEHACTSPFPATKKRKRPRKRSLVRIKGLEPPRLSASDPKSDVATNYTISAWFQSQRYEIFFEYAKFLALSNQRQHRQSQQK